MRIVIWIVEGTWEACIDAALHHFPSDSQFKLLHVTQSDVTEAADAAGIGLFGRHFPGRKPAHLYDQVADDQASRLLAAAVARLGHPDAQMISLRGRVEQEVVRALVEEADVLVVARDGDHARLGPKSIGHTTRFVVDHAPCAVLLVWPDEIPRLDSIPPPKHGPHPEHGPHSKHEPKHPHPPRRHEDR